MQGDDIFITLVRSLIIWWQLQIELKKLIFSPLNTCEAIYTASLTYH